MRRPRLLALATSAALLLPAATSGASSTATLAPGTASAAFIGGPCPYVPEEMRLPGDVCLKGDEGPVPGAAGFVMQLGKTQQQAYAQLEAQQRLRTLRTLARNSFGGTFAGSWIDHIAGGAVHLSFTVEAAESASALQRTEEAHFAAQSRDLRAMTDRSTGQLNVVPVEAKYSLPELSAIEHAIVTVISYNFEDKLAYLFGHVWTVGIHEPTNRVVVRADRQGAETLRNLLRDLPADAWEIQVMEQGPISAGRKPQLACGGTGEEAQRQDCNPLRGGIRIINDNGTGCTMGFSTISPGIITAGHCGEGNWKHGGRLVGPTLRRQRGGPGPLIGTRSDSQVIALTNIYRQGENEDGFSTSRWVYQTPARQAYQIERVYESNEISAGSIFCKSGVRTGETCGFVTVPSALAFLSDELTWFEDQIEMKNCLDDGDSGGPLYTTEFSRILLQPVPLEVGAGIGVIFSPTNTCPANPLDLGPFDLSWYSKLRNVELDLGVQVRLF